MDTWEDVKNFKPGDEVSVAGTVRAIGVVFSKEDTLRTLTIVNAKGQKVSVIFREGKKADPAPDPAEKGPISK